LAEVPHVGGLRAGPLTGFVLYVLLGLAAALALWGDRATFVPAAWHAAAPVAFGLFLAAFSAYRYVLVRANRYPAGKAFFQVGAGVLFITFLLPGARGSFVSTTLTPAPSSTAPNSNPAGTAPTEDLTPLLVHQDAAVRRLACEVARSRPDGARWVEALRARQEDSSAEVRAECAKSLAALQSAAP
jgi:hypothetical protein